MGSGGFPMTPLLLLLLLVAMLSFGCPAAAQDKECTARLSRMQPCITYVEGKSEMPSTRCCKGLQYVYQHSPVCLCELLSSTGGVASTPGINVTNAVMLPVHCKVPTNTSACPALLSGDPVNSNSTSHSGSGPSSSSLASLATLLPSFLPALLFNAHCY